MRWKTITVGGALKRTAISRANQILSSEIKLAGRFPVVDQGQAFIAGYCDDEKRVISNDLPLVIFGDHTRTVKFVDFPFILGADGTKVLKPREDIYDPKFFAYAIQNLDIPSRGYNRHFTILRERVIPRPEVEEQRKIVRALDTLKSAILAQTTLLSLAIELKKALSFHLFTKGLKGAPAKQTDIGPIPGDWSLRRLGDVCDFRAGGTPSRQKAEYWDGGVIPWVKTGEVDYCIITQTEEKITQAGLDNSSARLIPAGTLLMAMYGQGVTRGKVALLGIPATTNQACVAIFPKAEVLPKFLYHYFEYAYDYVRNRGHGANQKNLSSDILRNLFVGYPSELEDQRQIIAALDACDHLVQCARHRTLLLSELLQSMSHQLLSEKLKVDDLGDLVPKSVAAA